MIHITQEYKWNEKQNIFYPHKYDDVFDAIEKVPEDEISGYGFDGIEDQEELLEGTSKNPITHTNQRMRLIC